MHDALALESDSELSELDLEMTLGGEVIIGAEDEDEDEDVLYVPLPVNSVSHGGRPTDVLGKSQWELKFGKQYPPFNPNKRNVHSFLAEHDYHTADNVAKRTRFKEADDAGRTGLSVSSQEMNQSQIYDDFGELSRGQNVVLRISEDL